MAEKLGEALLELKTDLNKFRAEMGSANKAAQQSMTKMETRAAKFSKLMQSAAAIGGAVLAVRKLVSIGKDLIKQYGVQEIAERTLRSAIKSTGKEYSMSADALIDYAGELQAVTTYGDEATISAMALMQSLADLSEEGMKEVMPLIQDMAAAMGMDLKNAASMVGKTLGSTTNALARYGIIIDGTAPKEEKLVQLTEELQKKFGGLSRDLATTGTGALIQLNNIMGDIKEQGGKELLEILKPIITSMTTLLSRTLQVWVAKRGLNKALAGEASTVYEVDKALKYQQELLDADIEKRAAQTTTLKESQAAFDKEREKVEAGTSALSTQIGQMGYSVQTSKSLLEATQNRINQGIENIKKLQEERAELEKLQKIKSADVIITEGQTESAEDAAAAIDVKIAAINAEVEAAMEAYQLRLDAERAYQEETKRIKEEANVALEEQIALQFDLAASFEKLQKTGREWSDFLMNTLVTAYGASFEALGLAIMEGEAGWAALKEAGKEAIASLLRALGTEWAARAIAAFAALNFPAGVGYLAASAAAFTGTGIVKALAEGGDFVVPPGYPNDSYPMLVQSGERVQVTPPGQVGDFTIAAPLYLSIDSKPIYRGLLKATKDGIALINEGAVTTR